MQYFFNFADLQCDLQCEPQLGNGDDQLSNRWMDFIFVYIVHDCARTATGMDGTLTLIFAISETLRYIKMF